ncbi:MAG: diguanylate cyclase, partial [Acidobacteriota bacterium]
MSESVRETELAMVTLASIGEGVIRTDASGRVDYMNPVAEKLTGWPADDASGRDITEVYQVVDESTRRSRRSPVEMCLSERRTLMPPGLFTLRARTGDEFTIRDTISPLLSAAEELLGVVLVFRDLTRVRSLEREMAYITSHDTLTGLLNRQDFEIYVEAALEGTRVRKERHSLLHLDLMELKLVNDCYGHVAGDELLRQMAELMRASVGDWAVIARIGGGDFCLLLENHDTDRALDTAKTLQGAVSEFRFSWGGQYFEIGFNVGVVALDSSTESVSHALKAADTASYQARQRGRNKVQVHGAAGSNSDDRHSRLHWVQRIRQAIAGDRFRLFHQRIEPLGGGSVTHEILLRMVGDEGEIVSPGAFIPIAESYDLASLIDRWVVRRSVRLLSRDGVLGNAPVSLNLSGQSLGDEGFLEDLLGYLRMGLVDPARLRFEVTETHAV